MVDVKKEVYKTGRPSLWQEASILAAFLSGLNKRVLLPVFVSWYAFNPSKH